MSITLDEILVWIQNNACVPVNEDVNDLSALDQVAINKIYAKCDKKQTLLHVANAGCFPAVDGYYHIHQANIASVRHFFQWFFAVFAPRLENRMLMRLLSYSAASMMEPLARLAYLDAKTAVICNAGFASLLSRTGMRVNIMQLLSSKFNIVYGYNDRTGAEYVLMYNTPFEYFMRSLNGGQAALLKVLGDLCIEGLHADVLYLLQEKGLDIIPQNALLDFFTDCRERHIFAPRLLRSLILDSRGGVLIHYRHLSQGLMDLLDGLNYELVLHALPDFQRAFSKQHRSITCRLFSSSVGKAIHKHWHVSGLKLSYEETARVLMLYVIKLPHNEAAIADARNSRHPLGKFLARSADRDGYFDRVQKEVDLATPKMLSESESSSSSSSMKSMRMAMD